MRVVYIHQYFRIPEQGGAIRSYYLAKSLVESGVEVDVITAHNRQTIKNEVVDGINVHYLPVKYDNKMGYWARIKAFMQFMKLSYDYTKNIKNIDLVYATSTPLTVGITALLLQKIRKIPYYFEVRDLWPEAPIQMGAIKNKFAQIGLRKLEKSIYKNASKIVALSPGMKEGVLKAYKHPENIEILPNISDCEFFQLEAKVAKNEFYFGATEKFVISYTGAIGKVNKVDSLLDVALECNNAGLKEVLFIIAGKGSELNRLKRKAKSLQLENIRFVNFLKRDEIKRLLNITDVSFISFDSKPVLETNSPNKFFDSIAAGKMCIVNNKGWIKELIEENEVGFYYSKKQPKIFVKKLSEYLNNPALLNKTKLNARSLAESHFSREKLTKRFVELLDLEKINDKKEKLVAKTARA